MSDVPNFTFQERLGIFFTIESASLSAISCTLLLGYAAYKWVRRSLYRWAAGTASTSDASDSSLFINLMLADLIQSLGVFPSIRWMNDGRITEGSLCTAQGFVKQIGINGVALTSLAIAIQTFVVLVFHWRPPNHLGKFVIALIWTFVFLMVGINYGIRKEERYYGDTGYWCWIREDFIAQEIYTEYLWVWFSAAVMAVLYGFMFLVMRGIIVINNGIQWRRSRDRVRVDLSVSHSAHDSDEDKKVKAIANLMLFYPAVYFFAVFPNSLSRWLTFRGASVPFQYTLFASSIFSLSGFFNLVLFMFTRPELIKGPPTLPLERHRDVESIASPKQKHHKFGHLPNMVPNLPTEEQSEYGHREEKSAAVNHEDEMSRSPGSDENQTNFGRLPGMNPGSPQAALFRR